MSQLFVFIYFYILFIFSLFSLLNSRHHKQQFTFSQSGNKEKQRQEVKEI